MVFSCVDLLFHGYLAFKEARGHQIVDNADDDPDDTNRVRGRIERNEDRTNDDRSDDRADKKAQRVRMVLTLHPEMPDYADIQDHIGGKSTEVHDLCQTVHTDVEEEWQKHERKSGNEERCHQRHATLLIHLRERTWKRAALTHHVEHARD